jgi:hypothetical protein
MTQFGDTSAPGVWRLRLPLHGVGFLRQRAMAQMLQEGKGRREHLLLGPAARRRLGMLQASARRRVLGRRRGTPGRGRRGLLLGVLRTHAGLRVLRRGEVGGARSGAGTTKVSTTPSSGDGRGLSGVARLLRRAAASPWCGVRRKQRSGAQSKAQKRMHRGKKAQREGEYKRIQSKYKRH